MISGTDRKSIVLVSDFLSALSKAIKTSVIYPPEGTIPKEFKRICWEKLESSLAELESIDMEITRENISLDSEPIYSATKHDLNLARVLHRDGIRKLRISRGINYVEFSNFFNALLIAYSKRDGFEDIVNLLWEGDFDFIEYEAVDEMTVVELDSMLKELESEESVSEINKTLAELGAFTAVDSQVEERESRQRLLSEITSPTARQILENISKFSEEENSDIVLLIEQDKQVAVEFSAIDLLFDIAVGDKNYSDFTKTCDTIDNTFSKIFESENFPLLVYMVRKLRESTEILLESNRQRAERLRESFHRCGDRIRITKLTEILNRSEHENLEEVSAYLDELDASALSQLLWMLGELSFFPARKTVCELLEVKGRQRPDIIAASIYDSRWYVVRNTAIILGEIGTESSVTPLKKAAEHDDERVRWEASQSLIRLDSTIARRALMPRLYDESDRIRRVVVQHFQRVGFRDAYPTIKEIIDAGGFKDKEPPEQKDFLDAYGAIGGSEALKDLKKMARKWTPFGGESTKILKEMAVLAIGMQDSEDAVALLSSWARKSGSDLGNWANAAFRRYEHRQKKKTRRAVS